MGTDRVGREPAAPGNVADLLRKAAELFGDRPAVIHTVDQVRVVHTWAELDRAADVGATELLAAGRQIGDRVVIALPTGADIVATLFAAARAGLVAAPVAPGRVDPAEVAARLEAAAVVAVDRGPGDRLPVLNIQDVARWWDRARSIGPRADDPRASGEDLVLLARAGTDRPVMISHRAVLAAVAAIGSAPGLRLRPDDRVISVLPLHHPAGWVTAFLPLCAVGATAVIPDVDAPGRPAGAGPSVSGQWIDGVLATIRAERVTVVPAAPGLYRRLRHAPGLERALASVRLMTSGAAPLDPDDAAAIRAVTGQPVWEGYGVAESSSTVSTTLMTGGDTGAAQLPAVPRPGSVGLPLPGLEVRILGDDGDDVEPVIGPNPQAAEPAGPAAGAAAVLPVDDEVLMDVTGTGEVGRVALRGPTLFSGYWPDGTGGPGADGWFVTNDVGFLDDGGELHLVDRAGESLQVAGFTVYPREVEDVLTRHPYVRDAAVVGIPDRTGQSVLAVLVAQRGTRPTAADLDEFVAERLPVFKRPKRYRLVDRLPRTEVGRVDRDAVRRSYLDDPDPDAVHALRVAADDGGGPAGPGRAAPGSAQPRPPGRAARGRGRRAADDDEDLF